MAPCRTGLSWLCILGYLSTSIGGATLIKELGHQGAHMLHRLSQSSHHTHTHIHTHAHAHSHDHNEKAESGHIHVDSHQHGNWLTILSEIAQDEFDNGPEQIKLVWKDIISFPGHMACYQLPDLYKGNPIHNFCKGFAEICITPLTPPPRVE